MSLHSTELANVGIYLQHVNITFKMERKIIQSHGAVKMR